MSDHVARPRHAGLSPWSSFIVTTSSQPANMMRPTPATSSIAFGLSCPRLPVTPLHGRGDDLRDRHEVARVASQQLDAAEILRTLLAHASSSS